MHNSPQAHAQSIAIRRYSIRNYAQTKKKEFKGVAGIQ